MSDEEDEVLQRMYPKEPHTEVPPKKEEQPNETKEEGITMEQTGLISS